MFVKIFCGDSQKYLLLQSDNVTLDKEPRCVDYDIYPLLCAYIEEMSASASETDLSRISCICDEYKRIMELKKKESEAEYNIRPLESLVLDIIQNRPYCLLVPVLSAEEKQEKLSIANKCNSSKDICLGANPHKISVVEIDEKTYITTGPIFVMNDDGKTIDRV